MLPSYTENGEFCFQCFPMKQQEGIKSTVSLQVVTSVRQGVATALFSFVSLSKLLKLCSIPSSISLMKVLNHTGPNMDPWGMPLVTDLSLRLSQWPQLSGCDHTAAFHHSLMTLWITIILSRRILFLFFFFPTFRNLLFVPMWER